MIGTMMEHREVDSMVDLQLPVDDSLELGAAADKFAAEGEFLEVSDAFDFHPPWIRGHRPVTSVTSKTLPGRWTAVQSSKVLRRVKVS